ncbi:glycosyltransferase [Tumidithrix elongata RA019]|uniref:Glycosyltransferase n=1 Tax=Tumidithrix elongata BACA0141 TaxID=2716417 RepID=A0AAW9Q3U4_9CYAN|nr:glycosyltransferase [Tumidithrix elongata RA019]
MTTLSLCMIVKNESQNLARCLESVKAFVDEIVIVDTGSTDDTVEIAKSYGAKIDYFPWCHDFAAARNYSLSKATSEWILFLDADEDLVVELSKSLDISPDLIREQITTKLMLNPQISAFLIPLIDINQETLATPQVRLFYNRKDLQFVGRFHEVVNIRDCQAAILGDIHVLHYGYSREAVEQKNVSRNIPLLEQIRQEEGLTLGLLSCLAGMYDTIQKSEKAEDCYREAFERLLPHFLEGSMPDNGSYVPQLLFNLGVKMLAQPEQDFEILNLLCLKGLEWFPRFPPLIYLTGAVLRGMGFALGATAYFERCLNLGCDRTYSQDHPFDRRYMTTYAAYDLGCAYFEAGDRQAAIVAFEQALSFDDLFIPAQERIRELTTLD